MRAAVGCLSMCSLGFSSARLRDAIAVCGYGTRDSGISAWQQSRTFIAQAFFVFITRIYATTHFTISKTYTQAANILQLIYRNM